MTQKLITVLLCGLLAGAVSAEEIALRQNMLKKGGSATIDTFMEEDGLTTVELKGKTGTRDGNMYLDGVIQLPAPLDLTGKALKIKLKTDTPDVLRGVYFRAYNQSDRKKPALSFQTWRASGTITGEYREFLLVPEENGFFNWEKGFVSGVQPTAIDQFRLFAGTPVKEAEMNLKLKSVEVVPSPRIALTEFCSGLGVFRQLAKSRFQSNALISTEAGPTLCISGRSPAEFKGFNYYEAAAIELAEPVDLSGKTVSLKLQYLGTVNGIYIRFFNQGNLRKPALSFVFSSNKPLPTEAFTADLTAGQNGALKWEPGALSGDAPTAVNRIEFIFCTNRRSADFGLKVSDLTVR